MTVTTAPEPGRASPNWRTEYRLRTVNHRMQSAAKRLLTALTRPGGVHTATMIKAKTSATWNARPTVEVPADAAGGNLCGETTLRSPTILGIKFFDSAAITGIY